MVNVSYFREKKKKCTIKWCMGKGNIICIFNVHSRDERLKIICKYFFFSVASLKLQNISIIHYEKKTPNPNKFKHLLKRDFIQEKGSLISLFCLFNTAFKRCAVSSLSLSRYLHFLLYNLF